MPAKSSKKKVEIETSSATSVRVTGHSEIKDLLRQAGLRATLSRAAVYQCLVREGSPLTHSDVCEKLADSGFDRATVYRNLADLTDVGLLERSDLGDHLWRFEPKKSHQEKPHQEGHAHFVCTECGDVSCLPADAVAITPSKGTPKALRGRSVQIQVRGTCNTCA